MDGWCWCLCLYIAAAAPVVVDVCVWNNEHIHVGREESRVCVCIGYVCLGVLVPVLFLLFCLCGGRYIIKRERWTREREREVRGKEVERGVLVSWLLLCGARARGKCIYL